MVGRGDVNYGRLRRRPWGVVGGIDVAAGAEEIVGYVFGGEDDMRSTGNREVRYGTILLGLFEEI